MKKTFTLLLAVGLGLTVSAQSKLPYSVSKHTTKLTPKPTYFTGLEEAKFTTNKEAIIPSKPASILSTRNNEILDEEIGYSLYDLQTNQSVQNRLVEHNGKILAAWTFSAQDPPGSPDRGTGYQMKDGGSWMAQPNVRIEATRRTGWPSLMVTGSGKEVVINHPNDGFNVYTRATVGSGEWVESMIPTATTSGMLWPRAVAGGADGNSLHAIGITTPTGNGGAEYNGQDGALLYYRSTDEGATWDITDFQPTEINSDVFAGFGGDSYSIDANGDHVAYAYFSGSEGDSFVMVSDDNGSTFTKRVFLDLPMDNWIFDETITDYNNDGVVDTLLTTDGSGTVHVDSNGKVHIFYGTFRFYDDLAGDGFYTTFPGLSGIYYWNSDMEDNAPVLIYTLPDDFVGFPNYPDYRSCITGMVNVATDPTNPDVMALAFSAMVSDLTFQDTYNFRQIFAMKSSDGGTTWTGPMNVTPYDETEDTDMQECVYPTVLPKILDNKLRLIYSKDSAPGVLLRAAQDDVPDIDPEDNYIRYLEVDLNEITGVEEVAVAKNSINVYPNPSTGIFQVEKKDGLDYQSYVVYDVTGKVVFTSTFKNNNDNTEVMDLSSLESGMYFLKVQTASGDYSQGLVIE